MITNLTKRCSNLLVAGLLLGACAAEPTDDPTTGESSDEVLAEDSEPLEQLFPWPSLPWPRAPTTPTTPTDPVAPSVPATPSVPTTPTNPAVPTDPIAPVEPTAPVTPPGPGTIPSGPTVSGSGGVVNATIVVGPGQTFDGGNKRYVAGRALGDGSQNEGQKPMFKVENGGRLLNVVLGAPAADGIHTHGNATLQNIHWEDIGEDAMTIKESGTVTLTGGSAKNGDDKVFQINAPSTFRVSSFRASNAGKFIRQNGDTKFKVQVFIDNCDISNMKEAIFRTDSATSTVSMTNTRYSKIGKAPFVGVQASNITQRGNSQY